MIFLSAQPDDFYFTWQLELLLFNLFRNGVDSKNIHILISYNKRKGVSEHFVKFISNNKEKASFFLYQDNRESSNYKPSIRPHIINQHFISNPWLEEETVFYHDSDILFKEMPDFNLLSQDDIWYVSDTKAYLDTNYLKRYLTDEEIIKMCEIVGIHKDLVCQNDSNCGGAQYVLKKVPASFWLKVERDCENMYKYLSDLTTRKSYLQRSKGKRVDVLQAWCTDMWCVFWGALLLGKTVQIHSELNFVWPINDYTHWQNAKLIHYSGENTNDSTIFRKDLFVQFAPYYCYSIINNVNKETCGSVVVDVIKQFELSTRNNKYNLKNMLSVHFYKRGGGEVDLVKLYTNIHYLYKNFNFNFLIIQYGQGKEVDLKNLPPDVCYIKKIPENAFDKEIIEHYFNEIFEGFEEEIYYLSNSDEIITAAQILSCYSKLLNESYSIVYPCSDFLLIDSLFLKIFSNILDVDLLEQNNGKFGVDTSLQCSRSLFIWSTAYKNLSKSHLLNNIFLSNNNRFPPLCETTFINSDSGYKYNSK